MVTKDSIHQYIVKNKSASGRELAEYFGITKQAVNKHIKALVQEQKIG